MLSYNISEYSTIKKTLFFANKEFEADVLLKTQKCEELVPHIIVQVDKIHKLQTELGLNLIFFNRVIKEFANKKKV